MDGKKELRLSLLAIVAALCVLIALRIGQPWGYVGEGLLEGLMLAFVILFVLVLRATRGPSP